MEIPNKNKFYTFEGINKQIFFLFFFIDLPAKKVDYQVNLEENVSMLLEKYANNERRIKQMQVYCIYSSLH
jgi:hypothetical protein